MCWLSAGMKQKEKIPLELARLQVQVKRMQRVLDLWTSSSIVCFDLTETCCIIFPFISARFYLVKIILLPGFSESVAFQYFEVLEAEFTM